MQKLKAHLKKEDFKILIKYHSIKWYFIFEALLKENNLEVSTSLTSKVVPS